MTNSNSNDVSMYSINTTTGILTSIGLIAAGTNPSSVAVDPTGKFAYVTNSASNDVSIYSIDAATGALTRRLRASRLSRDDVCAHDGEVIAGSLERLLGVMLGDEASIVVQSEISLPSETVEDRD